MPIPKTVIDPRLLEWATPTERKYLEATNQHGSGTKAAKALGVNKSCVNSAIERLKKRAATQGYSPDHDMTHTVPDGYKVKGVSTYYNRDGVASGKWVKSSIDQERQAEIMRAALAALAAELPRVAPVVAPAHTMDKLANLYTLTDSHVGALCWDKENLDPLGNWDLSIAERTLIGCFEHMVNSSPAARVGIVAQLGDFLHSDGLAAVTPTSGHLLDQDGRFPKVVKAAIRILRHVINFALQRHQTVIVLMAEGNHDLASSVWLRAMFQALYENEPRVHVIDSELPYYVYQHGRNMLAWHHGHLKKTDQLPILFASQFPKMWGDTDFRYAHSGHRHHEEIKEHSGMKVTQHSTLVSRDAYASRGGWMSMRQCTAITYHSDRGQVACNTVTPEMLEAA
ncbi:MAG: winged helix-turn-helix domain-containing protein [Pseudomonadota bacterium]